VVTDGEGGVDPGGNVAVAIYPNLAQPDPSDSFEPRPCCGGEWISRLATRRVSSYGS
jgi:hypothetical protein